MIEDVVARWHAYVDSGDPALLDALLADDVVFHSPIVFTPQRGREVTSLYLQAAGRTLGGEHFRYVEQVAQGDVAVLEFETELDGRYVNGVDIVRCDDSGRIVEFRVMVRPLQAVDAVHRAMGAALRQGGPPA